MDNELINNILYGAIRNDKHRKIRFKGYLRSSVKLLLNLLFKRSKNRETGNILLLNFLDSKIFDFQKNIWDEDIYARRVNFDNAQFRPIYWIEFFINLSFLINVKPFQKIIFRLNSYIFEDYIKKNDIRGLICGPATTLTTFLGWKLKEFGKEVIIFQHGIYQLSSYKVEWYEKQVMTKILVWGTYYEDLYIKQGIEKERLKIISPYFSSNIFDSQRTPAINWDYQNILFIGQQLNKISNHVFKPYNQFLSGLIDFYALRGKIIIYKPHPREQIEDTLTKENLERVEIFNTEILSIENIDVFYSVNSTLLVELYLKGKPCYQVNIDIKDFQYDHFNKFTGIPTLDMDSLSTHLNLNNYSFYLDPKYLNVWEDYTAKINILIKGILNTK